MTGPVAPIRKKEKRVRTNRLAKRQAEARTQREYHFQRSERGILSRPFEPIIRREGDELVLKKRQSNAKKSVNEANTIVEPVILMKSKDLIPATREFASLY